jgi:hypothetical protein
MGETGVLTASTVVCLGIDLMYRVNCRTACCFDAPAGRASAPGAVQSSARRRSFLGIARVGLQASRLAPKTTGPGSLVLRRPRARRSLICRERFAEHWRVREQRIAFAGAAAGVERRPEVRPGPLMMMFGRHRTEDTAGSDRWLRIGLGRLRHSCRERNKQHDGRIGLEPH